MAKDRSGYVFQDKNGAWYARTTITDSTGKRRNIKKRAKDKQDAKRILKHILRELDAQGGDSVDRARLTFNDLADYYAAHYCQPAVYVDGKKISGLRDVTRARSVLPRFRQHFGKQRLREIKYSDLQAYYTARMNTRTHYNRPPNVATMNRELGILRRIFNIGTREGWLPRNPFTMGEPLISPASERRREQILSITDEQKLIAACKRSQSPHLLPLVICLLDTGARKSELSKHLRWRSVCFASRTITIEGHTTKTLKARHVGMTERMFQTLSALFQTSSQEPDARVFDTSTTVHRAFSKACKAAGIAYGSPHGITLHSLRHTAATRLVKGQMPLHVVGRLLGHSQPQTTYRYLSADAEAITHATAILDAVHAQAGMLCSL